MGGAWIEGAFLLFSREAGNGAWEGRQNLENWKKEKWQTIKDVVDYSVITRKIPHLPNLTSFLTLSSQTRTSHTF